MELIPAVYGLDTLELPDGYTPLEAVTVIKALDEHGEVSLLIRSTESLNAWESLGMLDAAADVTRQGLSEMFETESADDEDDD